MLNFELIQSLYLVCYSRYMALPCNTKLKALPSFRKGLLYDEREGTSLLTLNMIIDGHHDLFIIVWGISRSGMLEENLFVLLNFHDTNTEEHINKPSS